MQSISVATLSIAMVMAAGISLIASASAKTRDHYQCYDIAASSTFTPRNVTLKDQFGSADVAVVKPVTLCAPVSKNGALIVDPVTHFVCYAIQSPISANKRVRIRNQFGSLRLSVGKALALCVPSRKAVLQ